MPSFKQFFHIHTDQPVSLELTEAHERRSLFLRYINRGWLVFGTVTLVSLPFFPVQRPVFIFLVAVIFPTFLLIQFLNSLGRTVPAGIIFTFAVNFGFYGLFLFLARQMGARQAFETQGTVLMLMGLAVLFAGSLINKWAAPVLAFVNTILVIGTRLILAPEAEPRPSVLVFWWMLALIIWLYERILAQAFTQVKIELAERRHAEQEREALISELESKNAELERFNYTVSHDLKTPLVTIKGFLGYLTEDIATGNEERLKRDIDRIASAVDKMNYLLRDLLELSRIGRLVNPSQEVAFEEIVREATDLVHEQMQKSGTILTLQPNLPGVYGDRQRLVEVLQNLLDNSIKFMGAQKNPQIEIGQRGEDAERGKPVFYVKDNGIGIEPEYHERVFGLFNKLNPDLDGTGVGLALVKRIVEFYGGRIWVESEAGQGATFYFTLPRG